MNEFSRHMEESFSNAKKLVACKTVGASTTNNDTHEHTDSMRHYSILTKLLVTELKQYCT